MALRLILVGAVAGLGLNLPVRESAREWRHAAETWMYSRMASWDARMPTGMGAFVVVAEPTLPFEVAGGPLSAIADVPAPVVEAPVASAVPIEAELTEGLEAPTISTELEEPVAALARPGTTDVDVDVEFDRAQEEVIQGLAADFVASEDARRAAAAPVALGDSFYESFAFAVQRDAESVRTALDASAPLRTTPRFEPMEVGDELYAGVAFALNRVAEGLTDEPARAPASTAEPADARQRWTHAVGLTRAAAHAWANLLHGPAVVVLSH